MVVFEAEFVVLIRAAGVNFVLAFILFCEQVEAVVAGDDLFYFSFWGKGEGYLLKFGVILD